MPYSKNWHRVRNAQFLLHHCNKKIFFEKHVDSLFKYLHIRELCGRVFIVAVIAQYAFALLSFVKVYFSRVLRVFCLTIQKYKFCVLQAAAQPSQKMPFCIATIQSINTIPYYKYIYLYLCGNIFTFRELLMYACYNPIFLPKESALFISLY